MCEVKNKVLLLLLLLFLTNILLAGTTDTLPKILPRSFILQYAGSIGFISAGIYYPLAKEKFGVGLQYGYVPESMGGRLNIITAKLKYFPWSIPVWKKISFMPFNPVFFASYTMNKGFHLFWPKDALGNKRSYWWSTALRLHIGASSDIKISELVPGKSVSVFFEANIPDLYFIGYVNNPGQLSLLRIIRFGTGIKLEF